LLGLPFPYLPQHVTLLDALTIGVPAFFLMLGRHPSGQPIRPGFLREVGWFALSTGLVMGSAGLAVFLLARWRGEDEQTQRTMLLSTLIVQGLLSVLRLLADREGPPGWADRCLRLWVVVALPLYAGVMYLPLTGYFFELTPLRLAQWSIVLALSLPALALSMAFSRLGLAFTR
jgi:magnesium-transporting ATPase (P-type)